MKIILKGFIGKSFEWKGVVIKLFYLINMWCTTSAIVNSITHFSVCHQKEFLICYKIRYNLLEVQTI